MEDRVTLQQLADIRGKRQEIIDQYQHIGNLRGRLWKDLPQLPAYNPSSALRGFPRRLADAPGPLGRRPAGRSALRAVHLGADQESEVHDPMAVPVLYHSDRAGHRNGGLDEADEWRLLEHGAHSGIRGLVLGRTADGSRQDEGQYCDQGGKRGANKEERGDGALQQEAQGRDFRRGGGGGRSP